MEILKSGLLFFLREALFLTLAAELLFLRAPNHKFLRLILPFSIPHGGPLLSPLSFWITFGARRIFQFGWEFFLEPVIKFLQFLFFLREFLDFWQKKRFQSKIRGLILSFVKKFPILLDFLK